LRASLWGSMLESEWLWTWTTARTWDSVFESACSSESESELAFESVLPWPSPWTRASHLAWDSQ